jgi:hypothetical protein
MRKTLILIVTAIFSIGLYAQNEIDALRYSLINYGGTARFAGISGAYGAVGADFTSLSQNPAGIGLYRKSEFTFTPVISSNNTTSNFLGQSNYDFRTTGYLGNVGFVFSQNVQGKAGPVVQLQFGFGVNQLSRFSNRMIISGFNNANSLLTTYVDDVNSSGAAPSNWDDFGVGLAYDVNLIFFDSTNMRWAADMEYGGIQQTKTIETRGSTNETVISAGANIADKLFLGITFAFPFIRYEEVSTYTENDIQNRNTYFNSFVRQEYLNTRGSGFNFKAGIIYMPVEFIRIGGAIHTPTNYYNMSDSYNASMTSNFSTGERFSGSSPQGLFDYRLRTPFRAMGSVAFIIGKYGLLSADYEYMDYSQAWLRSRSYSFFSENDAIRSQYTSSNNFRFGAELKAGIAALRGGYNIYGTPFKGTANIGKRTGFSVGAGIREKSYFVDFAYSHGKANDNYFLYSTAPASFNQVRTNSYNLTLGFRF